MVKPFKDKTIARLKKAKGQIDGIMKMIEEDKYCIEIITQLLALQGALKGAQHIVLESHLNTCGWNLASTNSKKRQQFIQELVKTCNLSNR